MFLLINEGELLITLVKNYKKHQNLANKGLKPFLNLEQIQTHLKDFECPFFSFLRF